ncbi:MAG: ABC transporter permease [Spirochaetaceae bacterium]|jgi:putative ABC transport system permease protein|nr:ABC transporter permease [Spirochaetaceae bacterium]
MVSVGKTYGKAILREIRFTLGRFTALFGIVALGVGFLAGLLATTPDLKVSMDRYFDRAAMMDVWIKGTMGFTARDAALLRAAPEFDRVLPAYVTDALVTTGRDEALAARIYGLPLEKVLLSNTDADAPEVTEGADQGVNKMEIIEGRAPERDDECLVQEGGGYLSSLETGASVTVAGEDTGAYAVTRFIVTGVVRCPLYISTEREPCGIGNGRLALVLYVREAAYALPAYTDIYSTVKGAASLTSFTGPYERLVEKAMQRARQAGADRAASRREEVVANAGGLTEAELAGAEAAYREAKRSAEAELAAAREKLDAGAAEIARGEAEIARSEDALEAGELAFAEKRDPALREIAESEDALEAGGREIAEARRRLSENKALLDAAREQVEKHRGKWYLFFSRGARERIDRYDAGLASYTAGLDALSAKERELREARETLAAGKQAALAEFSRAEAEFAKARHELADGRARLLAARGRLREGEAEYRKRRDAAEAGLADAGRQLELAKQSLADNPAPLPQWYVLNRNANVGCANYKANVEKIADVAAVFPLFFILIAALVALTTMTRMVEEERVEIGTLKALGYHKRAILLKYLVYCALTGALGSAAGMVSGFRGLPLIIYNAFSAIYRLPRLVTEFNVPFALISCGLVLAGTTGATVYACYRSLWETPARLMIPRPPASGKRIFLEYMPFLWNRMKFTHKVTARNLIRQKKHFFMTMTGIAGCTALMVAAFGLRDSMTDIAETQFEDLFRYDLQIELRSAGALKTAPLPRNSTAAATEGGFILKGSERFAIGITVPQNPESLSNLITLRERRTGAPLLFSDTQTILTEKIAERLGLSAGDVFTLENAQGIRGDVTLSAVTENYVGAFSYIGGNVYRETFGSPPAFRTVFAYTGIRDEEERDAFLAALLSDGEVMSAEFTARIRESYRTLLGSIGFVVLVLIFAAGGLAVIVLYNLTNININERKREIATLRVLGFHRGEAAAYIFREITVLSLAGAFVGLCAGIPLHGFIIGVAENPDLMFGRRIAPLSFVLSGGITLFFSFIVDLFMLKKLDSIKMADSMKASD